MMLRNLMSMDTEVAALEAEREGQRPRDYLGASRIGDPKHKGPGFGFIAIRGDRSWFGDVVPPRAFQ